MRAWLVVLTVAVLAGCAPEADDLDVSPEPGVLHSPAFADGGDIPVEHTCDGADTPPPLQWEATHPDAVELVLVVDDPDAPGGSFGHWLVAGIPPGASALEDPLPAGAVEGTNSFGGVGWAGPCPPPGDDPHTYRFELVALDAATDLEPGFTAAELADAIAGHELSSAVLEGRYGR